MVEKEEGGNGKMMTGSCFSKGEVRGGMWREI
jgi:hypothetical protein